MTHIWNAKTLKYDIHISIPSPGIKEPKTILVGSFKTEIEAIAGKTIATNMLQILPPIPTNEHINNWIASKMSEH